MKVKIVSDMLNSGELEGKEGEVLDQRVFMGSKARLVEVDMGDGNFVSKWFWDIQIEEVQDEH